MLHIRTEPIQFPPHLRQAVLADFLFGGVFVSCSSFVPGLGTCITALSRNVVTFDKFDQEKAGFKSVE